MNFDLLILREPFISTQRRRDFAEGPKVDKVFSAKLCEISAPLR